MHASLLSDTLGVAAGVRQVCSVVDDSMVWDGVALQYNHNALLYRTVVHCMNCIMFVSELGALRCWHVSCGVVTC